MKVLYTAEATAHGGREGRVKSSDNVLDLALAMPKELGGSGGAATNPEQLFAAGYSACFESATRHVARTQKLPLKDCGVTARVSIGPREGGFQLAVELKVKVEGLERAQAERLIQAAHQVCPYSHATRGNIEVTVALA